jgi:LuxR family maltose regulon positive regulatory protein
MFRAALARDRDILDEVIANAERGLEVHPDYPPDSPYYQPNASRGILLALLSSGYDQAGDYARSEETARRLLAYARQTNDLHSITIALARIGHQNLTRGRLSEVLRVTDELWELRHTAAYLQPGIPAQAPQMYAVIHFERNELDQALEQAQNALDACGHYPIVQRIDILRLMLLIYEQQGKWDEARRIVEELETHALNLPKDRLASIVSMARARLEMRMGNLTPALQWIEEYYEGPGAPRRMREKRDIAKQSFFQSRIEQLFFAQVLINQQRAPEAVQVLSTLAEEFAAKEMIRLLIDTGAILVIALERAGRSEEAQDMLIRTMQHGAAEGFIHTFTRFDQTMATVFNACLKTPEKLARLPQDYLARLADALGVSMDQSADSDKPRFASDPSTIERMMLTTRELEILELLSMGYTNKKIAEKLYVSINTVKTHMSNLFDKLEAHNRVDALVRAREARLIE